MWHIEEGVQAPQRYAAVYFIYLPVTNRCLWSNDLSQYQLPQQYSGDIDSLQSVNANCPTIPVDPHHALSLNWITIDEMVTEMPYVTDSLKACLRLIKDVKEEEHGNDKEGLSTGSQSTG